MSEREFKKIKLGGDSSVEFHNASKLYKDGFKGVLFEGIFEKYVEEERSTSSGKKFTAKYYIFKSEDEVLHHLDSFGLLDRLMQEVNPGDYCRVSYLGKENDYHRCEIEVA